MDFYIFPLFHCKYCYRQYTVQHVNLFFYHYNHWMNDTDVQRLLLNSDAGVALLVHLPTSFPAAVSQSEPLNI